MGTNSPWAQTLYGHRLSMGTNSMGTNSLWAQTLYGHRLSMFVLLDAQDYEIIGYKPI